VSIRILAAHQPHFWPWLGYLDKWRQADVFVVLDDVDFPKHDFVNRNRIAVAGLEHWLTVPIQHCSLGTAIANVEVSYSRGWPDKHLNTLRQAYPPLFRDGVARAIEELYAARPPRLLEWCLGTMRILARHLLGCHDIHFQLSSALRLPNHLKSTARLVAVCKEHGARAYLSGRGARDYLDLRQFEAAGIEVRWLDRSPPDHYSSLHHLLHDPIAAQNWLVAPSRPTSVSGHITEPRPITHCLRQC